MAEKDDYKLKEYLDKVAANTNSTYELTKPQQNKFRESMKKYKKPVCLCSPAPIPGLVELEEVACPRAECPQDIKKNGICHCRVFRSVLNGTN